MLSFRPKLSELWVMNADGTNPVKLTTSINFNLGTINLAYSEDIEPSWSPDGKKITFSSNRERLAYREIYLMNADVDSARSLNP